jgi:hypothetical protein
MHLKEATMNKDILNTLSSELKKTPYSVPEGYFTTFREQVYHSQPAAEKSFSFRLAPYISMAAAFLLIVTAGTFLLRNNAPSSIITYEDYIVHSDMMVSVIYDEDEQNADVLADMNEEEIIEYLIYTGTTAENIELSK